MCVCVCVHLLVYYCDEVCCSLVHTVINVEERRRSRTDRRLVAMERAMAALAPPPPPPPVVQAPPPVLAAAAPPPVLAAAAAPPPPVLDSPSPSPPQGGVTMADIIQRLVYLESRAQRADHFERRTVELEEKVKHLEAIISAGLPAPVTSSTPVAPRGGSPPANSNWPPSSSRDVYHQSPSSLIDTEATQHFVTAVPITPAPATLQTSSDLPLSCSASEATILTYHTALETSMAKPASASNTASLLTAVIPPSDPSPVPLLPAPSRRRPSPSGEMPGPSGYVPPSSSPSSSSSSSLPFVPPASRRSVRRLASPDVDAPPPKRRSGGGV